MAALPSQEFRLLPVVYPDDLDELIDVGFRAFRHSIGSWIAMVDPNDPECIARHAEFRKQRLAKRMSGDTGGAPFKPYYAKMVDENNKIVAYCAWHCPTDKPASAQAADGTAAAEKPGDAVPLATPQDAAEREAMAKVIRMDLIDHFDKELKRYSDEFIKAETDKTLWYLATLCTLPEYQRKGLGSRLVRWGLDLAAEDAKKRPDVIKGAYCVATQDGLRTYLKAGMKDVGHHTLDFGTYDEKLQGNVDNLVWLVDWAKGRGEEQKEKA